jgi:hypothetical protein
LIRKYISYPTLSGVYLEDSHVLGIYEQSSEIRFELEAVLTPESPDYHDPYPGEQYCYARGDLIFREISRAEWFSRSFRSYTDASGEEDLGNIDVLTNENGIYAVEGDWGKILIQTGRNPEFHVTRHGKC